MLFGQHDAEKLQYQREWHDWAQAENTTSLAEALKEGQDLHEVVLDGLNIGSICALKNKMRLFDFLRENSYDFDQFDGHKRTTLMAAAQAGTVKIAAKILSRGDPVQRVAVANEEGMRALHFSAKFGCAEMTQFLISKGADVHAKDLAGNTALHWSMVGGSPQTVSILLREGADASAENNDGKTPDKMRGGLAACRQALGQGAWGGLSSASSLSSMMSMASHGSGSASSSSSHASTGPEMEDEMQAAAETLSAMASSSAKPSAADERDLMAFAEHLNEEDWAAARASLESIAARGVNPLGAIGDLGSALHPLATQAAWDVFSELAPALESLAGALPGSLADILDANGDSAYDVAIGNDDAEGLRELLSIEKDANVAPELMGKLRAKADAQGSSSCVDLIDEEFDGLAQQEPELAEEPDNATASLDEPHGASSKASNEVIHAMVEDALDALAERDDVAFLRAIDRLESAGAHPLAAEAEDGKSLLHHLAESGKGAMIEELGERLAPCRERFSGASFDELLDPRGASPYAIALRRDNAKLLGALLALDGSGADAIHASLQERAGDMSARGCLDVLAKRAAPTDAPKPPKP